MKLNWLGQAGYRLTAENGTGILIDPYLSDTLHRQRGEDYARTVPICTEMLRQKTDVLIITHIHADHMDIETIDAVFAAADGIAVLAPRNVLSVLRERYDGYDGRINYMMFEPGVEISLHGLLFRAVYACHSDVCPVGAVIEGDGRVICHTGDTMYHVRLTEELPRCADALLLPVNGQGNNMNCVDAARLTRLLEPKTVLPMHWDMFARFGCDVNEFIKSLEGSGQRIQIPAYYTEIAL